MKKLIFILAGLLCLAGNSFAQSYRLESTKDSVFTDGRKMTVHTIESKTPKDHKFEIVIFNNGLSKIGDQYYEKVLIIDNDTVSHKIIDKNIVVKNYSKYVGEDKDSIGMFKEGEEVIVELEADIDEEDTTKTTEIKLEDKKVLIIKGDKIIIKDGDEESVILDGDSIRVKDIVKTKKKEIKGVENRWFLFDIGFNNYLNKGSLTLPDADRNLKLNNVLSLHYNIGLFQQRVRMAKGHVNLIYGVGLEFNDFRFQDNIAFRVNDSLGRVEYPKTDLPGFKRNKLGVRYLTIPLQLQFMTNPKNPDKSWKFQAGVQVGYRYSSFFKTVWEEKNKSKRDYYLNDFKYSFMAKIGYGDFNLYASYTPTPLFEAGRGPELTPVALGLVISGW